MQGLKVLVMDEADKLLDMDFEQEINQILAVIPRKRQTMLFSATMTSKVKKLQRASLHHPVRVRQPPFITMIVSLCHHMHGTPPQYSMPRSATGAHCPRAWCES